MELNKSSTDKLDKVHSDLKRVVLRAIALSEVPFIVTEGIRSLERQKKLVAEKKSKTLASRHITGHAVDLAPLKNGGVDWNDLDLFKKVAQAMKDAADELGVQIRWGGCWEVITDYPGTVYDLYENYVVRCTQTEKKVFLDFPHFELPKSDYPA